MDRIIQRTRTYLKVSLFFFANIIKLVQGGFEHFYKKIIKKMSFLTKEKSLPSCLRYAEKH